VKTQHRLGAALLGVALAPFVAFATGACGGKVLAEAGGDSGPGETATGSGSASVGPTSSSTATATATATGTTTGTTTATGTATATTTTTSTSPTGTTTSTSPVGTGNPFDGGVYNDGRSGSLVAIAEDTACPIPSAVTYLEQVAPVTVARELAFCGPSQHFVQCPTEDGLQCSDPSIQTLLFDRTCIDQCEADEYVIEVDDPQTAVVVPPGCRVPAGAPGFPSYCCPCGF
jgi:hypothetical protein